MLAVAGSIGEAMNGYRVIVCKSTVPVGTADKVRTAVKAKTTHEFDVVSNPEFLKEGAAVEDFMKPDRIVIGGDSPRAIDIMKSLYAPFVRTENPILVMDNRSAEMTKYAANAFLATKISFVNEVANLCERVGADVNDVRRGMARHRIGHHFLFPGTGYGGSCFLKDVQATIRTAHDWGWCPAERGQIRTSQKQFRREGREKYGASLSGRCFGVWGLAFKPRTDDMREAPSINTEELSGAARASKPTTPRRRAAARWSSATNQLPPRQLRALRHGRAAHRHRLEQFGGPISPAEDAHEESDHLRRPKPHEPDVMREQGFTYYPIGRTAVETK